MHTNPLRDDLQIMVAAEVGGDHRQMILLRQVSTGRKFFLESRANVNDAAIRAEELQGKLLDGKLLLEQVIMDRRGIKMIKWSETN